MQVPSWRGGVPVDVVLVIAVVATLSLALFAAATRAERRRRRAERAAERAAQRVEQDFRRAFGDTLPPIDPAPRERPRAATERPAKRSNSNAGKVRPQG